MARDCRVFALMHEARSGGALRDVPTRSTPRRRVELRAQHASQAINGEGNYASVVQIQSVYNNQSAQHHS